MRNFIIAILLFCSCNSNSDTGTSGKLYSGSTSGANVYYYMLPNGKILRGCPTGGLENFDFNAQCALTPDACGTYTKEGGVFSVHWNDNAVFTGKIKSNGDIDLNGSLIGEVQKVPATLSAAYEFGVIMGGTSVAETTTFNTDGSFVVNSAGGVDTGDGVNSAEWKDSHSGKYKIDGFTITITENSGKIASHTIYTLGTVTGNPDVLGWDGNFLSKVN